MRRINILSPWSKELSLKKSDGQATVEFALIAVILIVIVFGIIEGGRVFSYWLIITNEAREAARYGAVSVGDPVREPTLIGDVEDMVRQRTNGLLDQAQLTPIATLGTSTFTVQINYNVELFAAPLLAWFPNPVLLSAISTMRSENATVGGG